MDTEQPLNLYGRFIPIWWDVHSDVQINYQIYFHMNNQIYFHQRQLTGQKGL